MKNSVSFLTKSIFTGLLILSTITIKAQSNLMVNAGVGFLELFHVGADYELKRISVGASAGYSKENGDNDFALSANIYYYIAGQSKYAERLTWFTRLSACEAITHGDGFSSYMLYLSPRVGRDFYLFENGGIKADVGVNILLHEKNKTDAFTSVDDAAKFLPGFSLGFFYRF